MRPFLAILEGSSPKNATPVLASEDPELIGMVANALATRLGGDLPTIERILHLTQPDEASDRAGGTDA